MRQPTAVIAVLALAGAALCGCSATAQHLTASAHTAKTKLAAQPTLAPDPTQTINPAADAKAAAILQNEDNALETIVGVGAKDMGTSAQMAWFNGPGNADDLEKSILAASKSAGSIFTATDEAPPSMVTWSETSLPGDVMNWYLSDTGSGPTQASTQKVYADLAALKAAAAAVAQGQ